MAKNFHVVLAGVAWRAQRLALTPAAISAPCSVRAPMQQSGFGLPAVLNRVARNERLAYDRIQRDLTSVVSAFRELHIEDVDLPTGGPGFELFLTFAGAERVPARHVSSGTLLALGLLTATHSRDLADIVLIDDLDQGLHLAAQLQMMRAIRSVMKVRDEEGRPLQVVCSAHSPYLLHDVAVEEVRIMALDAEGHSRIVALERHPDIDRWRSAMTAGELWANLGEGWALAER